ncbi:GNAT family N-acetyltransferase [Verrucomicrobiaceae bacterium N1E253]|uniref:GNAT family N-acetyltransferase n=1 Tax=Oceaniferula marina TaxID=2748318 RepID=A0A851GK81_9BACT|nr:GNAT family protein [Oceaniferula marina]NWK57422.1 GNAT family N-acetyltransferase [Oceaniferula marina]
MKEHVNIEFASEARADSFWSALDEVAREEKYLIFIKGPNRTGTRDFVREIIQKGWSQYYAVSDDRVVGWCDITRYERAGLGHVGHLGMGVIQEFRGKGIGRKLLQVTLDDAFAKGVERVELEVFSSNARARALYLDMGFEWEGCKKRGRCHDGEYEDIVIMGLLRDAWTSGL